jgi:hypothetical protein
LKSKIKEQLSRQITNYTIEHGKISLKFLSPLRVSAAVEDLKILFSAPSLQGGAPVGNQLQNFSISSENMILANPLLSRKLDIYMPEGMVFDNGSNSNFLKPVDYSFGIIFGSNSIIRKIQMSARKIQSRKSTDSDSELFDSIKNFSLLISNEDRTEDHVNTAIKLNIDALNNKVGDKILESNFELIASNMRDFDSNGSVNTIEIAIEKSSYNDITNNFGLDVNGSYRISAYTRSAKADFELKIINFKSLITSLNKTDSEFPIFSKKSLNDTVQLLELMPTNPKDTKYDRYYRITSDIASKKATINGVDLNSFIQKLLVNGGNSKK